MICENGLASNRDQSEAVLFSTSQRAKELYVISTIDEAGSTVSLSSKIMLLGVTLDGNLNFNDQIKNVYRASFFHIRALGHMKTRLTLLLVTLFSHESTTLIHCTLECHLLILAGCS